VPVARTNAHIHSFNRGECSAAALARTDLEPLRLAAEVQENLLPYVIGKTVARPGSKYLGGTPSNNQARLLPFVFSVSDKALLELSDELLRVWIDGSLVTRPSVTSTVTNGTFAATEGWIVDVTGGAEITFSSDANLKCPSVNGTATLSRPVTTTSTGVEHALRIDVQRGKVTFRCGTTKGEDSYIQETELGEGDHSLAFTPTDGTYHVWFHTTSEIEVQVDSITVESSGTMTLPTPWETADLRNIRYDQSGDIVYLANENYQQRKIERRDTRSWSVVKYFSDRGPVTTSRTASVSLKPAATRGGTTLTANRAFFLSDHDGAIFKLNSNEGQIVKQTFATAGEGDYISLPPSLSASVDDVSHSHAASGSASGTHYRQWSFESSDIGWADIASATGTASNSVLSNQQSESWRRFRIKNWVSGTYTLEYKTDHGGGFGIGRVTSISSSTVANVETVKAFLATTSTQLWQEGEWSDHRGWPSAVAFFDGRLWWGGRDKIWGSVSDDFENYDEETEGDSGPILRDIATGAVNQVRWLLPLTRLIIGTEGSEVVAKASSLDEPLTPTEFTLRDASTQGSASVSPVKADGVGYFVQRSGKRVYGLELKDFDHVANDLTRLNDDIGSTGLVELAVQRQPDTRVWCVREDGQCAVLLHEPKEDVLGWVRVLTGATLASDGYIESVCVLPGDEEDEVYWSVKRNVNGNVVRYVEKLAMESEALGDVGSHFMGDSYKVITGPVSIATGIDHLLSEQVIAWGTSATGGTTGPIGTVHTVTDGHFPLGKSYSNVVVGLKYDWRYKSAKLAYGAQGGTALLQPKKVSNVGLLAENLLIDSVQYGKDFTTMYPLPRSKDGADVATNTLMTVHDERAFPFSGNWDTDSRVCLKGSAPYPFTALGLVVGTELQETV
jgi:hypothetical protein